MAYQDIVAAAERIGPHIRRTPVFRAEHLPGLDAELWLKLESLQLTGSFKARGATNRLLTLPPEVIRNGLVAASGGNHGLATAYVARQAGVPATIYLPSTAVPLKAEKLRRLGADVRFEGDLWDQTHIAASAEAERTGAYYLHPFADEAVVDGQGTVALELLEQVPEADVFLIAIGGGGLISGMAQVIRHRLPNARIIGIEPYGAPTLRASLDAGHVVRLPQVTTKVATMACGRTAENIYDHVRANVDEIVLIEDAEMQKAAELLWFDYGIAADMSGAASLAALLCGAVVPPAGSRVAGLVCGAGTDGMGR
jgi:threonine dehydratase